MEIVIECWAIPAIDILLPSLRVKKVKSQNEKKVKWSTFGPFNPPKISEVEGLACVIIATRGFCVRQNSYGFKRGNLQTMGDWPARATDPRGATSPAAKHKERRSR